MIGERTQNPITLDDPTKIQGVCIIETESSKRFYFTKFTQHVVNKTEEARQTKERLAPNAAITSTLGRVYSSRAYIPWGPGLQDEEGAIRGVAATLSITNDFLEKNMWRSKDERIREELDVIAEIAALLEEFPKSKTK